MELSDHGLKKRVVEELVSGRHNGLFRNPQNWIPLSTQPDGHRVVIRHIDGLRPRGPQQRHGRLACLFSLAGMSLFLFP